MTTPRGVSPKRNPSHPSPESAEVRMCNTLRHAGLRWSVGRGTMSPEAQRRIPPRGGTSLSPSPRRPRCPGPSRARGQQCILSDMCVGHCAGRCGAANVGPTALGWVCPAHANGRVGGAKAQPKTLCGGRVTRCGTWALRIRGAREPLGGHCGRWGAGVVGGDWVAIDCDGGGHSLVRARCAVGRVTGYTRGPCCASPACGAVIRLHPMRTDGALVARSRRVAWGSHCTDPPRVAGDTPAGIGRRGAVIGPQP
jgi:hypothetical protein